MPHHHKTQLVDIKLSMCGNKIFCKGQDITKTGLIL